jgi:hypothetical protein
MIEGVRWKGRKKEIILRGRKEGMQRKAYKEEILEGVRWEGRKEGRAEGRKKGRAEGRKEGYLEGRREEGSNILEGEIYEGIKETMMEGW